MVFNEVVLPILFFLLIVLTVALGGIADKQLW